MLFLCCALLVLRRLSLARVATVTRLQNQRFVFTVPAQRDTKRSLLLRMLA